jgi:hypothetical protein
MESVPIYQVQGDAIRKLVETVWPDDKDMAEDFM